MPLLRLDNLSLNYGTQVLLDQVNFTLHKGNKIGLLGRNGEGKTTLLKIIAGEIFPDSGERWLRPGVKIAWLDQSLPAADDQEVYDVVASGLAEVGELLSRYHHAIQDLEHTDMRELERVQQQLEAKDGWRMQQRVDTVLTQLQLSGDVLMKELSGGWRRRVALARALVSDPDILLLDEPTNHLDIPAIEWLEKQLQEYRGAIICITHDRAFLQQIANQIIELDRGKLYPWEGDYHSFLRYREQELAAEERANALFDKKLAQEEQWIRQGIKARRTRNEGRVRALKAMRNEHSQRRSQMGKANFNMEEAERSGKVVAELSNLSHSFDGKPVIKNYSGLIVRGDRIGIVGANGAGKSTLIKIILGELMPDQGTVKLGSKLEVAYFDQLRAHLIPEKNLIDNICEGRDFIEIDGKRRHAISYLGDFLFTPDRVRTPVKALSGGEQNRAILAKLFSKPANLLVLDEPTNDLDIETLELLEEILLDFKGTVLLVSHDREFMDKVVTSIMVLEGDGVIKDYVGDYSNWAQKGGKLKFENNSSPTTQTAKQNAQPAAAIPAPVEAKKKLSYKDQRELDNLPALIERLEQEQSALEQQISTPEFYQAERDQIDNTLAALKDTQVKLEQAYQRWDELEHST
ncbi:MAG: ATP-binding cassette domain-containing protein [Pseudomonadales bacterium]|nr:ATP-binding cassette domain-containing protein [Pseudomonadales bacterium]